MTSNAGNRSALGPLGVSTTALLFHHVEERATSPRDRLDVTRDQLRAHLEILTRCKGLFCCREDEHAVPRPVLITFDDGRASAWTAADLLESAGWRGYFFIPVAYLNDAAHLSRRQVAQLAARGHVIGSHSMSHPTKMSRLSTAQLRSEWKQSADELAHITGQRIRCASVPGGDFSDRVANTAVEAGIEQLFTSTPTFRVRSTADCLVIGRFLVTRSSSPTSVLALARRDPLAQAFARATWSFRQSAKRLVGTADPSLPVAAKPAISLSDSRV